MIYGDSKFLTSCRDTTHPQNRHRSAKHRQSVTSNPPDARWESGNCHDQKVTGTPGKMAPPLSQRSNHVAARGVSVRTFLTSSCMHIDRSFEEGVEGQVACCISSVSGHAVGALIFFSTPTHPSRRREPERSFEIPLSTPIPMPVRSSSV